MAVPIKMPDVGTTVDEVTLVKWLVEEGAEVRRGDMIAEIETDKATVELESVAEGVLLRKMVSVGDVVAVGAVIAYVGESGEIVSSEVEAEPEERPSQTPLGSAPSGRDGKPRVSPIVRNLAKRKGVDLDGIAGSGAHGMITREDVVAAARARNAGE